MSIPQLQLKKSASLHEHWHLINDVLIPVRGRLTLQRTHPAHARQIKTTDEKKENRTGGKALSAVAASRSEL